MKVSARAKGLLKWAVKLMLTATALYFVFTKIDVNEMLTAMKGVSLPWLLLAVFVFAVSKAVSALRLNRFYGAMGLPLGEVYNLKLYWLGMFYNLFLPGSIGGDGYKVYLLKQHYPALRTRKLISATLLDRLSGMVLLFWLAAALTLFSSFRQVHFSVFWLALAIIILSVPGWYLLLRLFFRSYLSVFWASLHLSFWVQVAQLAAAFALLQSLEISAFYLEYLALFLVSSALSILPLTIGGAGIRELVFMYGLEILPVAKAEAIAFTLLFFFVTAFNSLLGIVFAYEVEKHPTDSVMEK